MGRLMPAGVWGLNFIPIGLCDFLCRCHTCYEAINCCFNFGVLVDRLHRRGDVEVGNGRRLPRSFNPCRQGFHSRIEDVKRVEHLLILGF